MRIAVVTPEYPPDTIGGGGVVFQALVDQYRNRHDVCVFSAADSTRSWTRGRMRDGGSRSIINRYPLVPVARDVQYLRSAMPPSLGGWSDLRKDLASWRPDVAHLHGYGHAFVDLAARVLKHKGVPFVYTCHGVPRTPLRRNIAIAGMFKVYQRLGAQRTIRAARAVTAVSTATAQQMHHDGAVVVIPNGVNTASAPDPSRIEQLRSRIGLPKAVPVIAAAGRLSKIKGFDLLIRALNETRLTEVVCVIAGSDDDASSELTTLAGLSKPGVSYRFPGHLDRQAIADLFSIAEVVVVPSRQESFGLVALEAIAAGSRLVATKVDGLGEFLNSSVAQLVEPEDIPALSAAISEGLVHGRPTTVELSERREFLAAYSWYSIALRYEALLSKAVTG